MVLLILVCQRPLGDIVILQLKSVRVRSHSSTCIKEKKKDITNIKRASQTLYFPYLLLFPVYNAFY